MLGKAQKNKRKFIQFISGLVITGFLFFANITNAVMYEPGETLDPACLPTDLNCGVYAPATSGSNSDITALTGLTTALSATQGGTGTSTYSIGDILFADSASTLTVLNLGVAGQFLKSNGTQIVWDTIPGGGDMLSSNNLSELTDVTTARANLGLVIGTNVQANSARLTEIAGLSFADGNFLVGNGSGWTVESGATVRTSLGLGNVENTALSTWGGSVNLATLGTVTNGTWQGNTISALYLDSSVMTEGENISLLNNNSGYVTSSTARTSISETVLGLSYDNVTGIFSLTSGYEIPTTVSTTNWNNFYTTPSGRISLGTGLVWSGNTIQANTGYNIPLTASTTNWNNTYDTVTASSSNWQTAFSWGNHASAGYLTSYTETDPIWNSVSSTYLATTTAASTYLTQANAVANYLSLANWNATTTDALDEGLTNKYYSDTLARNAVSFSGLGLTYNNGTGVLSVSSTYNIPLTASTTNWQTAFSWGNHASAGYLTSYTETDPIWNSVSSTYVTNSGLSVWSGNINISTLGTVTNGTWQGNAISALYLDSSVMAEGENISLLNNNSGFVTSTQVTSLAKSAISTSGLALNYNDGVISIDTDYNIPLIASTTNWNNAYNTVTASSSNWQTAFSWGNHASAGYALLAGQSGGQTLNGGTGSGESLTLSSTAHATKGNILFGNSAYNEATNRLMIGTTTDAGYALDVTSGNIRNTNALFLGSNLAAGSNVASVWLAGAYRPVLATTAEGKVAYKAEGGTQGLQLDTSGRSIAFNGGSFTGASGSEDRTNGFLDSYLTWNNAAQKYWGFRFDVTDTNSLSTSLLMDLQKNNISQFVVRKDGNVGINTSTPGYKLTIAGVSGASENALYIAPSTDGTSERASITLDNWEVGQDYNASGNKDFYIKDSASSTARFFIDKQGNVGVGTTTPQSAFHLASGNFTQTVVNPSILGNYYDLVVPSGYSSIAVSGDYAYFTNESISGLNGGLYIVNIVDKTSPVLLSKTSAVNFYNSTDIEIKGKHAYVLAYNYLSIVDISNPINPQIISSLNDATNLAGATSLYLSGNYAYIANQNDDSFKIVDISDLYNLKIIGGLKDASRLAGARSIYVDGDFAYIASETADGVSIINVEDIFNPVLVGFVSSTSLNGVKSIDLSGNYLYTVNNADSSLTIIDISSSTNPNIVGTIKDNTNLLGARSVYVSGNYAYVGVQFNNSVRIIDISDVTNPFIFAGVKNDTYLSSVWDFSILGKYAYAMSYNFGLTILDLTGITAPTANIGNIQSNNINVADNFYVGNDSYLDGGLIVGKDALFGGDVAINGNLKQNIVKSPSVIASLSSSTAYSGVTNFAVAGNYLYTANQTNDSISVTDISDPYNPEIISLLISTDDLDGANGIAVSGKYAYVANMEDDSLRVVDISNPRVPTIVGGVQDGANLNWISKVVVSGNRAYVINIIDHSMRIIDISDPINPKILGGIDSSYFGSALPQTIFVSGNYVFVGTDFTGAGQEFSIIDVSDANNPVVVGDLGVAFNTVNSIYVSGRYAYIGGSNNDFFIFDLANVTDPISVGSESFASSINSIIVSGNYAYIKEGSNLHIYDVTDPTNLNLINTTNVGAGYIQLYGKNIYQLTNGLLKIIDVTGIEAPTANIASLFSNKLNVADNVSVGNDAYIKNGLMVGGNSLFNGALSIAGGLSLTDATSSLSTTIDFTFTNSSTNQWTLRLDTSDNRFYFRDANGNDGVYLAQNDTSWSSASDSRLKENVLDLNVLDRINNFRAVSFNWKDSGRGDLGAIAQELYDIFPEVVSVGSDEIGPNGEGAWGIKYDKLGVIALQGVKELKQQLDVYNALLLTGGLNEFVSQTTQSNTLSFSKIVNFNEQVYFSVDNVGSAVILSGENAVRVEFVKEFVTAPIVNLTLASDVTLDTYFVESVDTRGFTIRIRPVQGQDVVINWHAFGQVSNVLNNENSFVDEEIPESESTPLADNLTDLANNYLEDNGLSLDDTLGNTNTTTEDVLVETVEDVIIEEIPTTEVVVSSTEDNI